MDPAEPEPLAKKADKDLTNEEWEQAKDTWNRDCVHAWEQWQAYLHLELQDGVIDQYSLKKFLATDVAIAQNFKQHIEEKTRHAGEESEEEDFPKPTYKELSLEYGLTMTRLEWLHSQFNSFLPEGGVVGGVA